MFIEVAEGTRQHGAANRNRESHPCLHRASVGGDSVNQDFPEIAITADSRQVGGSHYRDMQMQPWDVMQAVLTPEEFRGFLKGNVIKYAMRHKAKNGAEDLRKVIHYAQLALELQYGQAMGDEQPTDDPFPCIETECAINTN
jgi:hypothetical protein